MRFDEKILALREERGFTREELAEKVGVKEKELVKWEEGKAKPNVYFLKRLAAALETSEEELYDCIDGVCFTAEEKECFENIAKFKKTSIFSCILLLFSVFLLVTWEDTNSIILGLAMENRAIVAVGLCFFAVGLQISQVCRLRYYKKGKEYRLEYGKVFWRYTVSFLICLILQSVVFFIRAT